MYLVVFWLMAAAFGQEEETEQASRNLIYPLKVEARTGAKANYWKPAEISGVEIITQGYATAYAEARISLFDYLAVEQLRYESTVGTSGIERDFVAIDGGDEQIKAQLFNAIVALYVPPFVTKLAGKTPNRDKRVGPGFKIRRDVYNGELLQNREKIVLHDNLEEGLSESDLMVPAGQRHRFVTEFQQETYGVAFHYSEDDGHTQGVGGIGHLKFRKPWAPSFTPNPYVLFSTIEAYGLAMTAESHFTLNSFFDAYFEADFLFGIGDIQLSAGNSLSDDLDDDYGIGCVAGGVTGGIEHDWIADERISLYTTFLAGIWGDHFYVYNKDDSDDDTVPLTTDVRLHAGAEVRAIF